MAKMHVHNTNGYCSSRFLHRNLLQKWVTANLLNCAWYPIRLKIIFYGTYSISILKKRFKWCTKKDFWIFSVLGFLSLSISLATIFIAVIRRFKIYYYRKQVILKTNEIIVCDVKKNIEYSFLKLLKKISFNEICILRILLFFFNSS